MGAYDGIAAVSSDNQVRRNRTAPVQPKHGFVVASFQTGRFSFETNLNAVRSGQAFKFLDQVGAVNEKIRV